MLKRTMLSRSLLLAFSSTAALSGTAAFAQQAPAEPQTLQRVEITGSAIRRTDAETPSPIQIITKAEIEQSGKGTVAEYLQTLTADGQGSVPFTYGRGFSGATSSGISLRGLGANATLVLINGRRVNSAVLADDAQRSYTDLNQIPLEAVERIDVVKDGASALYGSDAVAGVVNIILRKNFVGTAIKATYGVAQEGDGKEPRIAVTHGFGDLGKDGYNLLLNAEFGKKDPIYYRDRAGRNSVGVSAIGQPQWGFNPNAGPGNNIGRYGGQGWIPTGVNNSGLPSFIGNVIRINQTTGAPLPSTPYVSRGSFFPAAQAYCLANTNLPQNNPSGACINDQRMSVNQIQPMQETGNLYGRFTKALSGDTEAFAEVGYYSTRSRVDGLAIPLSGAVFQPDGNVLSQTAATQLDAAHPDNPFPGERVRLAYNPQFDTGITGTNSESRTLRGIVGIKGSFTGTTWNYDSAVSFAESKQTDTATNVMNWRVKNALINPTGVNGTGTNASVAAAFSPAYAALPAGTYWRIGENASLNSPAMYRALLADKSRQGISRTYGIDFKVDGEIGKLDGGPIGLAVGVEARRETISLPQWEGQGDYTGLSLTSYGGGRTIAAAYAELSLPMTKTLEFSPAVRFDNYSDAGQSFTPKIGAKWKPFDSFAVRGTIGRGFRAPSIAEQTSLAGFGGIVVDDNARCAALRAAGVAEAIVVANCEGIAPTFVIAGNPDLEPERSTSTTLGIVWDITPKTSITADLWQIKRSGLIVNEDGQSAIDAGHLVRDPATALVAGDPGGILQGQVLYVNANDSLTRGLDIEVKQRFDLGGAGKVTLGATWTHLFVQRVTFSDGTVHNYAGTHGNCDITNCMGSPRDKVSFAATWESGPWRLGANVNYRGSMSNKLEQEEEGCAQTLADGSDYPSGCKVKSFTTLDISGAWKFGPNTEIFGSIANVLDAKPPSDFETYGAIGYNPLDYSGAIGRFFRVGLKHKF